MQALDITSYARTLQGESNAAQRFTDAQLIAMADRAQKFVVRSLRWPESRFSFTTIAGVQEYQIPEVIKILRVYVAGQPIVRTDIPTLEGQQIQLNDQTGTGGGPGGLVSTISAPQLSGGNYTPQWTGQPPAAYPVPSDTGAPTPSAMPWFIGRRPAYYMRGGLIGFVPIPLAGYSAIVDCVAQPTTLVNPQDACALPDIALDCLAWKVCELMAYSDMTNQGSTTARDYASQQFKEALGELQTWAKSYDGVGTRGPNIFPLRAFMQGYGQNRATPDGDDC